MTPANILTILRVLLVPVFILLVLYDELPGALATFLLAGVTDMLDGLIARRFNQMSQLGMVLDPIADKLLLVSSFIVLSLPSLELSPAIPLWLTISVISRDVLLVSAVMIIHFSLGRHTFPPSIWGKWTTTFQLFAVLLVLVANVTRLSPGLLLLVFWITLTLTIISALHYLSRGWRLVLYRTPTDQRASESVSAGRD